MGLCCGLKRREGSSLSDSSCLILWSFTREKFMRSTCLRILEMTYFLIGEESSPDASVDSTFDSSCRIVLYRTDSCLPVSPIRSDFILFSTSSSRLLPNEFERGLRTPESAFSLDCRRECDEPCRKLVIIPMALVPLNCLPSSEHSF